ncbi:MAG: hypothetical protein HQL06_05600 [Nitrospirae bacterium]|nr:hypothetical protein [Nitrospirota bacterium]
MDKEYVIKLPEYCNLLNFEDVLLAHAQKYKKYNNIMFDFSSMKWIGVLQASLIFDLVQQMKNSDKEVKISLPTEDIRRYGEITEENQAVWFLSQINFFIELQKIGATFSQNIKSGFVDGLAAFKNFSNVAELSSYEKALSKPSSYEQLLGGGVDVDLIRDGDLREILLHELGDNAFFHGSGKGVRFAVSEYPKSKTPKKHEFLSSFAGKSYIEVVVSDSGDGLLKTLKSFVPEDYTPNATIKKKLTEDVKTVVYAFEFNSTSNEERRRKILSSILKDSGEITQAIPTGLFYVASLAKLYGGQIIVRTGKVLVSMDYSSSNLPSISGKSSFASVRGTHVLVRVPRNRNKIEPSRREKPSLPYKSKNFISISLGYIKAQSKTDEDFIFSAMKEIPEAINECKKKNIHIVSILCDGLQTETKVFSLLLVYISITPRQECALLLFGVRSELMSSALAQWNFIKQMRDTSSSRMFSRSFILCSDDLSSQIEFGNKAQPDSTVIVEKSRDSISLEFDKEVLYDLYIEVLKNKLKGLIEKSPVKYPSAYYLIGGKYYTQAFYEIAKLLSDQIGRYMSAHYFQQILPKYEIGSVFVIAEPLYEFSDYIAKATKNIKWNKKGKDEEKERSAFINAFIQHNKSTKFLILTDVICSASEVKEFLSLVPDSNIDDVIVFCFVDGRDETFNYLTVERPDKSHTISVLMILKKTIEKTTDLPQEVKPSDVLIIDRRTLAPTSYDHIETPSIQSDELIRMAIESNALFSGHFLFQGKHYNYFLYLARLFLKNKSKLEERLNNTRISINKRSINNENITVFYLNEQRGWERLLYDYMSTKGFAKIEAINPDMLNAPPHPTTSEDKRNSIWFILPGIFTGETTRLCLEYASRFKPSYIHISIIVARMDSTHLSFYQNIRGYRDCKNIFIETISIFPITAHTFINSCPMCAAKKAIDDIINKTVGYPYLSSVANKYKDLFVIKEIMLKNLDSEIMSPLSKKDYNKTLMRAVYEEAIRNIEQRKKLAAMLDDDVGVETFIELVGEEFMSARFNADEVKDVTYTRYRLVEEAACRYIQNIDKEKVSIKVLLGIYRLFPDKLSNNIHTMFTNLIKTDNKDMFDDLLFLALLNPERYLFREELTDIEKNSWKYNMIEDTRSYLDGLNKKFENDVREFLDLLWLLRRSTTWGTNIENLRTLVQTKNCNPSDISKAFGTLESEGINRVLSHVNALKKMNTQKPGDSLWSVIEIESDSIEQSVEGIKNTCTTMKDIIKNANTNGSLLEALDVLDKYGNKVKGALENLFINPINVKQRIMDAKSTVWPDSKLDIRFNIKSDQPGILFSLDNLNNSLRLIIDNAVKCVKRLENQNSSETSWIEFDFSGYTEDNCASIMFVRDNLPWDNKIIPTGGMKQLKLYCQKYAAQCVFNPDSTDSNIKIQIIYKIDDTTRN